MSTLLECEVCGLAACDLPDGVDPELIFEDGLCQVCVRPITEADIVDALDGLTYADLEDM